MEQESTHEHHAEGGLFSGKLMLGLLVVLAVSFSIVMIKKYRALEAKVASITSMQAQPHHTDPVDNPSQQEAVARLAEELSIIKKEIKEIDSLLEKLGAKPEKKASPAHAPH